MNDVAIHVEGLSKRYRIGKLLRYKTLRDTLADAVGKPLRAVSSLFNGRATQTDAASQELILGMRKREIARKFDEIVAFAEKGDRLKNLIKNTGIIYNTVW